MTNESHSSAWLLLAAGENRQYGGNSGYEDQVDSYYSWDSTVKNHGNVRVGDRVALWDKDQLLGISVIEEISTESSVKSRFRCPRCGRANISPRVRTSPRFKCQKCRSEFDKPEVELVPVTLYRSRHDAAWTSLEGVLGGDALRKICISPKSQHSMRDLDWGLLESKLSESGADKADRAVSRVAERTPDFAAPRLDVEYRGTSSGHATAVVRVRRGQKQFRNYLLSRFGEACAFTGGAPKRVLDAGHLYSYAKLGEHHEHGGLMLRRDIHRLFDDGGLAVNPSTLRVDVDTSLESYPQYAQLHDAPLKVELNAEHCNWLEKHWAEHRP